MRYGEEEYEGEQKKIGRTDGVKFQKAANLVYNGTLCLWTFWSLGAVLVQRYA